MTTQQDIDTMTVHQLAQRVLNVQDACNLAPVAALLVQVSFRVWTEAHKKLDRGTEWVNKHPLVVVLVDKLGQLAGVQSSDVITTTDAFTWCHETAEGAHPSWEG